jgi:GTPase SAR1 family protein
MMVEQLQQAKLVLLGEMGSGKTSLVQRYVRGHYYENQVRDHGE